MSRIFVAKGDAADHLAVCRQPEVAVQKGEYAASAACAMAATPIDCAASMKLLTKAPQSTAP